MDDDEPYENTFSVDDLRKEVRRQWDARNALVKALKELPEVPDWRVLKLLSHAATFPEDAMMGKSMQRQFGFDAVAPKTEYEMGAGLWKRIRDGLQKS
jgi:hypothetical protein